MTKRDWLSVGLKVSGVTMVAWILLQAFGSLMTVGFLLTRKEDMPWAYVAIGGAALVVITVFWILYIRYAERIAARLLPEDSVADAAVGDGGKGLFLVATKLIGCIFVLKLASQIFQTVQWVVQSLRFSFDNPDVVVWPQFVMWGTSWVVLLGVSVYLLFSRKGLTRFAFRWVSEDELYAVPGEVIAGVGSRDVVFSLALRIVGVVMLLKSLPGLVGQAVILFPIVAEARKTGPKWETVWWDIVVGVASLYLLTGAKHLVRWVFRKGATV